MSGWHRRGRTGGDEEEGGGRGRRKRWEEAGEEGVWSEASGSRSEEAGQHEADARLRL